MQVKLKRQIIKNLPYFFITLCGTKMGEAWRMAEGADDLTRLIHFTETLPVSFEHPLPSLNPQDVCVGLSMAALIRIAVYFKTKNAKKYRHGSEYGSARWGTAKDIEPFINPVFANNVILTQTEYLTMESRPKNPACARNKNAVIIGGSGTGKSFRILINNLLQGHSSYVVTDPKGDILIKCGTALERMGYRIKVFNTINFRKSMHYNPFSYIHSEKDILKLVTCIIKNTQGKGKSGDDFWEKAEILLYSALIGYIYYEAPEEERNMITLVEMIDAMEVREDDEEYKNIVDLSFERLEQEKPNHFAVRQYKKYKLAAGIVCSE